MSQNAAHVESLVFFRAGCLRNVNTVIKHMKQRAVGRSGRSEQKDFILLSLFSVGEIKLRQHQMWERISKQQLLQDSLLISWLFYGLLNLWRTAADGSSVWLSESLLNNHSPTEISPGPHIYPSFTLGCLFLYFSQFLTVLLC